MIRSPKDLSRKKSAYARAGFVYKGRQPVPGVPGAFKHVWVKATSEKRTSRR